jgi:hypothetical protein
MSVTEYQDKYRAYLQTERTGEILITSRDDLAGQAFIFVHEAGHRFDWDGQVMSTQGFRSIRAWNSPEIRDLQAKYKGQWMEHLDEIADPEIKAFASMGKLVREFESPKKYTAKATQKYRNYFYSIEEIWARAYSQWIADITQHPQLVEDVAKRVANNSQFTPDELELLRPHLEAIMRARGVM